MSCLVINEPGEFWELASFFFSKTHVYVNISSSVVLRIVSRLFEILYLSGVGRIKMSSLSLEWITCNYSSLKDKSTSVLYNSEETNKMWELLVVQSCFKSRIRAVRRLLLESLWFLKQTNEQSNLSMKTSNLGFFDWSWHQVGTQGWTW